MEWQMIEIRSDDWKNLVTFAESDRLGKGTIKQGNKDISTHQQLKSQAAHCFVMTPDLSRSIPDLILTASKCFQICEFQHPFPRKHHTS